MAYDATFGERVCSCSAKHDLRVAAEQHGTKHRRCRRRFATEEVDSVASFHLVVKIAQLACSHRLSETLVAYCTHL